MTNGLSHSYQLDESTFIFRGIRSDFSFFFQFSMKIMSANRVVPDGLFCLPISYKGTPGLYGLINVLQMPTLSHMHLANAMEQTA